MPERGRSRKDSTRRRIRSRRTGGKNSAMGGIGGAKGVIRGDSGKGMTS